MIIPKWSGRDIFDNFNNITIIENKSNNETFSLDFLFYGFILCSQCQCFAVYNRRIKRQKKFININFKEIAEMVKYKKLPVNFLENEQNLNQNTCYLIPEKF